VKLGILINTDRHLEHVIGLTRAAVAQGHEVSIFAMDCGTRLLGDPRCAALCGLPAVSMAVCEHSAARHGMQAAPLAKEITRGSQLQNAMMTHAADRVVVL
jgi:predicted peroxiredoxin